MQIKVEDLSFYYQKPPKGELILHDINFEIEKGDFIGIIGKTSSGKSTLVKHLNGILKPKKGSIFFNNKYIDKKLYKKNELAKHVGMVFQYPEQQLFEQSVLKDVMFGLKVQGFSQNEALKKAKKALKIVGIDELYHDISPLEISGGQKRRVAIAGVLAMDNEVIILDEPTVALDPKGKDEILLPLANLNKLENKTIIMVSHDLEEIIEYTNRVIIIDKGRIIYFNKTKELFKNIQILNSVGLKIPQRYEFLRDLNENGFNLDTNISKIDEIVEEIYQSITKGDKWLQR